MRNPKAAKPDVISIVATCGAIIFVVANLVYRVAKGHWGSVAFMVIIAITVLAAYIRVVPLDDLDDDESEQ